jgi:hypothetical protein
MKDSKEIAKKALEPFINNTIEIKNQWVKPEVVEKVKLPEFTREFLTERLAGLIKNGQRIQEKIYIGQIGADYVTASKLISEINKICTDNSVKPEEVKIDEDVEDKYLILSFKKAYSPIKIDVLAKGMYEKEVRNYRNDYETMLRVMNTKESL